MLKSYLKIAWRNLFRNRTLSFINLSGLSISIAFCLLLFMHIRYEQSFDTFHVNKDRLYRMEMGSLGDEQFRVAFPLIVGTDLANTFPEVSSCIRFKDQVPQLIRAAGSVYKEEQTVYADPGFLTRLSFPLVKGDARTALLSPGNVVLSEKTAKKYFGDKDPMGQRIELVDDSNKVMKVVGIAEDAPANSSIQFSIIVPNTADPDYAENIREHFNQSNHYLLLELKPGVDEAALGVKINQWIQGYYMSDIAGGGRMKPEEKARFRWFLRPFADAHYNASGYWGHYTDAKSLYELGCIVVVILLLASLNYVLITIANAAARMQEVGVRKVMGARRLSIIFQSWLETQLTVGIAVFIGFGLAGLGVPLLRSVIGSGVTNAAISWGEVIGLCFALAVLLGVLAGYYPALLISRLKPADTIKSFSTFRVDPGFSRVLVVIQFSCCVMLMMGAFVIDRQMHYIQNKDLGFDKEQVLLVHNPSFDNEFTQRVSSQLFDFAKGQSGVLAYSTMMGGVTGQNNTNGYYLNGERRWLKQIWVGYNYFELLRIKVVKGRTFSQAFPTDTARSVRAAVVNESMWKLLGPQARLGVYDTTIRQTIIGVVKDYNFESLSKKIEPEVHRLRAEFVGDYLFRVRAGEMPATVAALGAEWKTITNNYPFEYNFLDESIAKMYAVDMQWQKAMTASCFFAILIACMGLFGLAAINVANRTKEIGIRKVLGAGAADLLRLLSTGFLRLVFISIVVAAPLAWWVMNRWLQDFAYRIEIRWWMFAVVGVVALAIALGTVSLQVWRAVRANPVKALRSE